MPTGSLSNYNLWQLGPLTTTFAAPASCVTATDYRSIADVDFPGTDILKEACEERQWGECLPSGSALDTHFSHAISSSTRGFYMPYFYPGLHCPSGWSTAGVAEKSGVGTAPSLSGIFTGTSFHQPGVSTTRSVPFINPMPNILLEALHAGETAILCCPTELEADPQGGCTKNFPVTELGTEFCHVLGGGPRVAATFNWDGTTVTDGEMTRIPTSVFSVDFTTSSYTMTLEDEPSEAVATMTGLTWMPMVTLIQGEQTGIGGNSDGSPNDSDDNGGSGGGSETTRTESEPGSTGTGGSETEEDGAEESTPNAAYSGKYSLNVGGISTLMAAWGVAAVLGAVLMAPM